MLLLRLLFVAVLLLLLAFRSDGVILYRSADPAENTTAPTGELAGSGWQFQGDYGVFLGTPIAPQFFITAEHLGGPAPFVFHGVTYSPVRQFRDPAGGDFAIWQIAPEQSFPFFAPLYTGSDELGKLLVVIGRGTQRAVEPIVSGGEPRGWHWSHHDHVRRWGTNHVDDIVQFDLDFDVLRGAFDADGSPHEAHLSSGDSGGAVFIQHDGVWKLAGINYAVDGLYSQPDAGSFFRAAIFDARSFYRRTGETTFELIDGPAPMPTGFYSTRISSRLPWIYSVIDPLGDTDADGVRHLLEYALHLSSTGSSVGELPRASREGGDLVLIYTQRTNAPDIQYSIEKTEDLLHWQNANATEVEVSTTGTLRTMKATVPIGDAEQLFLRVRVTRP